MKKIFFVGLALTAITTSAFAQSSVDNRRTLFMSFGQKNVLLEAPLGMCFLDDTDPAQSAALSFMKGAVADAGQGVLMAVFTNCLQISAMKAGQIDLATLDKGTVTWMNPYVGETSGLGAADYLDMREVSLRDYVEAGLKDYPLARIDSTSVRTDSGVSIAYSIPLEVAYEKMVATGITTAMVIHDIPVDVTVTRMSKARSQENTEYLYEMMKDFSAQQTLLNNSQ